MSNKKLAMISQPMRGVPEEEICRARNHAVAELVRMGYDIKSDCNVPLFHAQYFRDAALFWLGTSLQAMAECDAVYFCKGWEEARGCRIEHEAAMAYGLEVLYEE